MTTRIRMIEQNLDVFKFSKSKNDKCYNNEIEIMFLDSLTAITPMSTASRIILLCFCQKMSFILPSSTCVEFYGYVDQGDMPIWSKLVHFLTVRYGHDCQIGSIWYDFKFDMVHKYLYGCQIKHPIHTLGYPCHLSNHHMTITTTQGTLATNHKTLVTNHETLYFMHMHLATIHRTLTTIHRTLATVHSTLATSHMTLATSILILATTFRT